MTYSVKNTLPFSILQIEQFCSETISTFPIFLFVAMHNAHKNCQYAISSSNQVSSAQKAANIDEDFLWGQSYEYQVL